MCNNVGRTTREEQQYVKGMNGWKSNARGIVAQRSGGGRRVTAQEEQCESYNVRATTWEE
jgi:hypothetical protein